MPLLKFINVFIFQWFFVRITKHQEKVIENYKLLSFDLMPNGEKNFSISGDADITTYEWFTIQYWVLPLTGWQTNYIFLNKSPKYIRFTKKYII